MLEVTLDIKDPGEEYSDRDVAEWLAYVLHASSSMRQEIPLDEVHVKVSRFSVLRDFRPIA